MKKYHKIQSIFKRDEKTKAFTEEYALPEFEYLKDNLWELTEKIDGTNIRVMWDKDELRFGGKTDNASIHIFLLEKLQKIFTKEKMQKVFPDGKVCLYGEGFGVKIQSGGKYIQDGVDFILFDVWIDGWWLKRDAVKDISKKLGIKIVKIIGMTTLGGAIELSKKGFNSEFGDFIAEGIVLRPEVQLFSRNGDRVITKIKHKDRFSNRENHEDNQEMFNNPTLGCCKCGHPKTWHKVDGVCLRTERHGSMGAVASCNCEKYVLQDGGEKK